MAVHVVSRWGLAIVTRGVYPGRAACVACRYVADVSMTEALFLQESGASTSHALGIMGDVST